MGDLLCQNVGICSSFIVTLILNLVDQVAKNLFAKLYLHHERVFPPAAQLFYPFHSKLVHSEHALSKEKAEITSYVSYEAVRIIDYILKMNTFERSTITHFTLHFHNYLLFLLMTSSWDDKFHFESVPKLQFLFKSLEICKLLYGIIKFVTSRQTACEQEHFCLICFV